MCLSDVSCAFLPFFVVVGGVCTCAVYVCYVKVVCAGNILCDVLSYEV